MQGYTTKRVVAKMTHNVACETSIYGKCACSCGGRLHGLIYGSDRGEIVTVDGTLIHGGHFVAAKHSSEVVAARGGVFMAANDGSDGSKPVAANRGGGGGDFVAADGGNDLWLQRRLIQRRNHGRYYSARYLKVHPEQNPTSTMEDWIQ